MLFCLYNKHCYTIIINVIYNTIVSCDIIGYQNNAASLLECDMILSHH